MYGMSDSSWMNEDAGMRCLGGDAYAVEDDSEMELSLEVSVDCTEDSLDCVCFRVSLQSLGS